VNYALALYAPVQLAIYALKSRSSSPCPGIAGFILSVGMAGGCQRALILSGLKAGALPAGQNTLIARRQPFPPGLQFRSLTAKLTTVTVCGGPCFGLGTGLVKGFGRHPGDRVLLSLFTAAADGDPAPWWRPADDATPRSGARPTSVPAGPASGLKTVPSPMALRHGPLFRINRYRRLAWSVSPPRLCLPQPAGSDALLGSLRRFGGRPCVWLDSHHRRNPMPVAAQLRSRLQHDRARQPWPGAQGTEPAG